MNKDWFPFFSMLFWFVTKVVALTLALAGILSLISMLAVGLDFWRLVLAVVAPIAIGWFLLVTDVVYDLGTAEQRRRQAK